MVIQQQQQQVHVMVDVKHPIQIKQQFMVEMIPFLDQPINMIQKFSQMIH
jgi:hypothetical protein